MLYFIVLSDILILLPAILMVVLGIQVYAIIRLVCHNRRRRHEQERQMRELEQQAHELDCRLRE